MKKKLILEKFTIAKLNSPLNIIGGNGGGDDGQTKLKMRCVEESSRIIVSEENEP